MKYHISINQRVIVEAGLGLDLTDAAILDFCRDFASATRSKFMLEGNRRYYWLSHNLIREGLPILQLKKGSIYRRMKALCNSGFLEAHPDNMRLSASWYCFTPKADLLSHVLERDPSQKNTCPPVFSSEAPPHFDKGNNNNNNTPNRLVLNQEHLSVLPDVAEGDTIFIEHEKGKQIDGQPQQAYKSDPPKRNTAPTKNIVLGNCKFPETWAKSMVDLYLNQWLEYRQHLPGKKALQLASIQAQIDLLSPLAEEELRACVNLSISNGWQGLFPDRILNQRNLKSHADTNPISAGAVIRDKPYKQQSFRKPAHGGATKEL